MVCYICAQYTAGVVHGFHLWKKLQAVAGVGLCRRSIAVNYFDVWRVAMDLMKIGTDMLMSKLGASGADSSQITEMLGGLIGDGDKPDLGGLLSKLQSGGAADAVGSWLGSGENQEVDASALTDALDGDKLAGMASKLGVDQNDLLGGLASALPQMFDKASPNGELLNPAELLKGLQGGGAGGIMGLVGKLLGK